MWAALGGKRRFSHKYSKFIEGLCSIVECLCREVEGLCRSQFGPEKKLNSLLSAIYKAEAAFFSRNTRRMPDFFQQPRLPPAGVSANRLAELVSVAPRPELTRRHLRPWTGRTCTGAYIDSTVLGINSLPEVRPPDAKRRLPPSSEQSSLAGDPEAGMVDPGNTYDVEIVDYP